MGQAAEKQAELLPGAAPTLNEEDLATVSRFARWVQADHETIRKRIADKSVQPVIVRGRETLYSIPALFALWKEPSEFVRRARVQADEIELRVMQRRGELVDALDMERTLGRALQTVNRYLETILDVIERDVGLSPEQATAAERHLDELREEMHKAVAAGSAADGDIMGEEPSLFEVALEAAGRAEVVAVRSASAPSGAEGAVDMAAKFLLEILQAGPVGASDVLEQAKAAGMSEATVRRARKQLGKKRIRTKRQGRGWVWELA